MGKGWSHTFGDTLSEADGHIELVTSEGRLVVFADDGAGGWAQPQEFTGVLTDDGDGSYSIVYPDDTIWDFDAAGKLASITDWAGEGITIARNAAGAPTTATSTTGRTLTFAYTAAGLIDTVTSSDGRVADYDYTGAELTSVDAAGIGWAFTVNGEGRITEIRDGQNRLVVANVYDDEARVIEQTTPTGETVWFSYDPNYGVTTVTDGATGDVNVYGHDAGGRLVEVQDPTMHDLEHSYDSAGNLASVTDRAGVTTTYTWTADGLIDTITTPDGVESHTYDSARRLTSVTAADGSVTTMTYTGTSRVPATVTDPDGNTTTMAATGGLVDSVTDPTGITTTYTYTGDGQVATMTDPATGTTTYTYDSAGRVLSEARPDGSTVAYAYNAAGLLASVTDPATGTTTYTYDAAGNVLSETTPAGTTSYTYDSEGLRSSMTDPNGGVWAYGYNGAGERTSVTNPEGGVTTYTYGPLGRLDAMTDPEGGVTVYTYDPNGRQATVTDPEGGVTSYTYDDAGRTLTVTDPEGGVTAYGYDSVGRQTTVTDPTGKVTTTGYDTAGRPVTVTDPAGNITTTGYDTAGRPATVTDADGNVTTTAYDTAGRVSSVTDPDGGVTAYTYDAAGQVLTVTDPEGAVTTTVYDDAGRPVTVTDPLGNTTTTVYDDAGRPTSVTDATGATITTVYDDAGRPTSVADALGNATIYGYDAAGRQVTETVPTGASITTTYDDAGRVTSTTDLGGATMSYTYDAAGRVATVTDASGNTTTNTYDAAGRLTGRTFGDATTVAYTYDAAGRRLTMVDETGTTTYTYDTAGRPNTVTDGDGYELGYDWATTGQLGALTYPDASTATYAWNPTGTLASVAHPDVGTISYTYDDAGRPTAASLPGGESRTTTWDAAGNLIGFAQTIDGGAHDATLTYDPANRLAALIDGTGTTTYGYDPAGQLIEAAGPDTTRGYTYDLGRPATATGPDINQTWTHDDASRITNYTAAEQNPGTINVVVGDDVTIDAGDQLLIDHLEDTLGYTVNVIDDGAPEDVAGADLVVITQTVGTSQMTGKYVDEDLPILSLATQIWDEQGLVANQATGWPYGSSDGLDIVESSHPTVAGATTPHASPATNIGYAAVADVPADATVVALNKPTFTTRASLIAFDAGDEDANSTPVADKRVLLGYRNTAFADLTTAGWAILDSTIAWLNPPSPAMPGYDNDNRLTAIADTTIEYNARGLAETITDHTDTGTYTQTRTYNGDGLLTDITITGPAGIDSHHIVWNALDTIPQAVAIDTNGNTNNYLYGNQREAAINANNTSNLLTTDAHGNTIETLATQQHTIAEDFDPWGNPAQDPDPTAIGFGYRGELHIGTTIYLRNRDYIPEGGSFTSIDPLSNRPGTPTTSNPYHYADNNPVNLIDPLGLRPTDAEFRARSHQRRRRTVAAVVPNQPGIYIVSSTGAIIEYSDDPVGFNNTFEWEYCIGRTQGSPDVLNCIANSWMMYDYMLQMSNVTGFNPWIMIFGSRPLAAALNVFTDLLREVPGGLAQASWDNRGLVASLAAIPLCGPGLGACAGATAVAFAARASERENLLSAESVVDGMLSLMAFTLVRTPIAIATRRGTDLVGATTSVGIRARAGSNLRIRILYQATAAAPTIIVSSSKTVGCGFTRDTPPRQKFCIK